MKEIKCPKCNTTFKIDEQDYESILKQIKNHEFEKELREKEAQFNKDKLSEIKILESNIEKDFLNKINKKDLEIEELKNKLNLLETENE